MRKTVSATSHLTCITSWGLVYQWKHIIIICALTLILYKCYIVSHSGPLVLSSTTSTTTTPVNGNTCNEGCTVQSKISFCQTVMTHCYMLICLSFVSPHSNGGCSCKWSAFSHCYIFHCQLHHVVCSSEKEAEEERHLSWCATRCTTTNDSFNWACGVWGSSLQ